MTQRVGGGQSFINYVNPGELGAVARAGAQETPAAPQPELRMPMPPQWQEARIGQHLGDVMERAKLSGSITSGETDVVLQKLGNVRTSAALAEAYRVVSEQIQDTLIDLGDRTRLMNKLLEMAGKVPGGNQVVSPALTEAVGEDIFGMGALPLNNVEKLALKASQNDLIGRDETRSLSKALGEATSGWELQRAYNALRLVVNGCAISRNDRLELARSYHAAAARVGDAFMAQTRALNEDIFGMRPESAAMDTLAKADRNKALSRFEVTKLAAEIRKIPTKTELAQVYVAIDSAIDNSALITQASRGELARALLETDQKLGGGAIPIAATRAMNEDLFGIGRYPQHVSLKSILNAGEDNTISKQEREHLVAQLAKIKTKDEFEQAYPAVRSAVALNLITREDRQALVDAVQAASQRVESYLAVTRGLFEDIFGAYPPV